MKTIQQTEPQQGRDKMPISDYHPPVPAERYAQAVRLGYAMRAPLLLERAARGRRAGVNFMHFDYTPYAQQAYYNACAEGINLYPQYPFLHIFLTLACPWRRLAVLVEEEETPWNAAQVEEENELLSLHGWRVFRIPATVARLTEEDVLPDHLFEAHAGHFQYPGEKEEYEGYAEQLRTGTRDGFFRWLKQEHFSREALTRYQVRARSELITRMVREPYPSAEQEVEALMSPRFDTVTEQQQREFEEWATAAGYSVEREGNGGYAHLTTVSAWRAWQAAQRRDF